MDIRIDPVHVPARLEDADAEDFLELVRLGNEAWRRQSGTDLHDDDPRDLLARWRDAEYYTHLGVAARASGDPDGPVLGVGTLTIENTIRRSAEIEVCLADLDEHAAREVGDALTADIERRALDLGRSVLQGYTIHQAVPVEDRLVPPTGAGWIPAADEPTRRMLRNGYALGQVERISVFDLRGSFDAVDRLLAESLARAGAEYRPVWWAGRTPDEYAAGYAAAIARMSTDVPLGALSTEQAHWDAARVHRRDEQHEKAGALMGVTLVIHVPTGEVAAFNELFIGVDRTRPTEQWGTLVMPEHRGRRLGAIVKCVGLQRWREVAPESPCVSTGNAEENRFMLDVNEAVGFLPASYAGMWEKRLVRSASPASR
ncbi:GNAT family N-acetyltransferase [Microbacterium album]|uniref:N-acetyltransferase domain-containing protein n=1 Tax=Microbacterium album TaxID=2053191 RepID=A0A917ML10_9MICO|nr:GNAT family N-acetyltransferase [Microbacterium album]GGH39662.1 hypothetical protein GCM10010921_11040 [Microbacterium album]